jgi:hypothetical protein
MYELLNPGIVPEMAIVADRLSAAVVSSARSEWGKYYAIVEPPRTKRPDLQHEVVRRGNLFRLCNFAKLLQVDLDDSASRSLNSYFAPSHVETMSVKDCQLLPTPEKPTLKFQAPDAIAGLFTALRLKRTLELDDRASRILVANDFRSDKLVLIEDVDVIGTVVAVNLASLLQAHIKVMPGKTREEADFVETLFKQYDTEQDSATRSKLAEEICAALDTGLTAAELGQYSSCTIFTSGTPYGATVKTVPTGHFSTYPDCGLQVLRSIAVNPVVRTALLVDPSQTKESETGAVADTLTTRGAYVHTITGNAVNSSEVAFQMRELPYDLICFVAHGGYPMGHRLTISYMDTEGNEHKLAVRKVDSFSLVKGSDDIEAASFIEPDSIDGYSWSDPDRPFPPGTESLMTRLEEAVNSGEASVVNVEPDIEMRFCNCIRLGKENFFAMCDTFGTDWGPVVVNNTCNSTHHLSKQFVFGGARLYIGTLYSVLDPLAKDFMTELVKTSQPVGKYVFDFNASHFDGSPISCYALFGLPTHSLSYSGGDTKSFYISEVKVLLERLVQLKNNQPFHHMMKKIDWTIQRMKDIMHSK